ncbi:ATP-binding cassette domain-containing protein [Caulobacter sp. 17J65-9]|uniref:ABC transporter ATP-binding protein n=1 Tax=Caulobacter sp. 17J65-9 TaxID=2709382 RepID=UPI0013C96405|nr:ATP-binding cassette domain-containing protein [Caulobacter sp. 17J65-9]NEX94214.1 ATP-binding cassette domain-containing protein [Caulobacter sp. 17J65-9]
MPNVIELKAVELDYPLLDAEDRSFRKALFGGASARGYKAIRALSGVTLQVESGERLGLYGPNGSGKSSLLRVMAGIYPPSHGHIEVRGRTAALLGASAGANMEASAYENICTLLRIGAVEPTVDRVREIWAWTELNEAYLGLPLRMMSSGMMMKVLVAVVTALDAEILLMDEWLGVIDVNFMAKAQARMDAFVGRAGALVLASHSYALLERTCDRIVHLENGRIESIVSRSAGTLSEEPRIAAIA